ncbi:lysylphosphatidylglycerol synthase transmembrane domain-containing protein [Paenibacillus segetis]|uniref:lysylphosphatidylglycerol synthase transmembrane domain-containing protein n=1 Tax=Paenibacillus segetis TaxID=1325360 RepID=UPI0016695B28|nr:lysylphosphatidylglycerol synthase transmembrane domain-containing protein [Paenibacillus segetis]
MKNKIFSTIIVIVTFCIFLSFFLFTKGLPSLIQEIKLLDRSWILLSVVCLLVFWFFEMLVLYIITGKLYPIKRLLARSIKFEMIGQFFGAVSPFSAGSHPAQLYAMTERGIPVGIAGSILMIKFLIHQAVNIAILILAFVYKFGYFNARVDYFPYLCILGLAVHVVIMIFSVMFSVNSKLTLRILTAVFKFLHTVRLLKDVDSRLQQIKIELEKFHQNAALITKHRRMCLYATLFTCIQYLAFFSIPYCIYRSFGLDSVDMWTLICAQIFLVNFMAIIPLPGAAGGAEGGFYLIYSLFFHSSTILTAIFVWRLLTYYFSIAAGSVFLLVSPNVKKSH